MAFQGPAKDCKLCPRLVEFRRENQEKFPDKFNGAVPAFGPIEAELLVVGLAPGLKGANFSGRPFTGDYAGYLLYPTLLKFGFGTGTFDARPDDGVELTNARITNAVRCVPPQNKPVGQEENACRPFLIEEIAAMKNVKVLLVLGRIAHVAALKTFGLKIKDYPFGHEMVQKLPNGMTMVSSYHCSRYNVNTGRLTVDMFENVMAKVKSIL